MSQDNQSSNTSSQSVRISNAKYQELIDYLNTNTLLQPEDVNMFIKQFQNLVDGVFSVSINQEKGFLEEEIKELSSMLSGEYKGNKEAEKYLQEYTERLKKIFEISAKYQSQS